MATTKTVNYTDEQTTELVAAYSEATTDEARKAVVEAVAVNLGKTTRSVVAKLSREGVYKKAAVAGKRGGVKKADLATKLGDLLGLAENDADSLSKATLTALKVAVERLETLRDLEADMAEGEDYTD